MADNIYSVYKEEQIADDDATDNDVSAKEEKEESADGENKE